MPVRPEVARVVVALLPARCAEGLAGATTRPHGPVVGPACKAKCIAPSADAGEEMALRVPGKFPRPDFLDVSLIYVAFCYYPFGDEQA